MIYDLNLKKHKTRRIVLNKGVSLRQYSFALQSIAGFFFSENDDKLIMLGNLGTIQVDHRNPAQKRH